MLNFVVAHAHEARPIISRYKLIRKPDRAFSVYQKNATRLVVSGQGRVNMAAATAYLAGLEPDPGDQAIWINIGIAGHGSHPFGSLWRVNKAVDAATGKCVYPVRIGKGVSINGCALTTVDVPVTDYRQDCLYDMEASGFFSIATRFATREAIQSLKIVSDNRQQPLSEFNPSMASELIDARMPEISDYVDNLGKNIQQHIRYDSQLNEIIEKIHIEHHLTHSQVLQVRGLLHSLNTHGIDASRIIRCCSNTEAMIVALKTELESVPLRL